jgi:hypothetical protein
MVEWKNKEGQGGKKRFLYFYPQLSPIIELLDVVRDGRDCKIEMKKVSLPSPYFLLHSLWTDCL